MRVVDGWGEARELELKSDVISFDLERVRDMALIQFRLERKTWREIGRRLRMSHEGARKRWQAIPQEVKDDFRRKAMG